MIFTYLTIKLLLGYVEYRQIIMKASKILQIDLP